MTIYVDDGETVKIYPVKVKVAKAVITLLEADDELMWSETHAGYGVAIVDKEENKESIPYLMHKETGVPLLECQKAYDVAMEYLRNKAKLKG